MPIIRRKVSINFTDSSLTKQADKDASDINVMMAKYIRTGYLSGFGSEPKFGDFSNIGDFQNAMNSIQAAEEAFNGLPATLRKKFNNDPSYFTDFCLNPENRQEMVDLGLLDPVLDVAKKTEPAAE